MFPISIVYTAKQQVVMYFLANFLLLKFLFGFERDMPFSVNPPPALLVFVVGEFCKQDLLRKYTRRFSKGRQFSTIIFHWAVQKAEAEDVTNLHIYRPIFY